MTAPRAAQSSAIPALLDRLIAPRPYALIGLGSLLLFVADYLWIDIQYARQFAPGALVVAGVAAAALAILITVARGQDGGRSSRWARWDVAIRALATVLMAGMALVSLLIVIVGLRMLALEPPSQVYINDVLSFASVNAHTALAGRNPYTSDASFVPALLAYPHAPPTPLQGPIFGSGYTYPSLADVFAVDRAYVRDPSRYAAAFDPRTLHSYPALSFLIYLPLLAVGVQNVLWVSFAAYVGLLVWLVSLAPVNERGWVALTGLAALTIPFGSLLLDTELICLLFLLPAWRLRERSGWLSAVALGLALAYKQYCWFFAPLFLLDALLRHGWRAAARRALIACVAFLAPNLPFILASPGAWWDSMWLPLTIAVFPQGMGLVMLPLGRIIPPPPKLAFSMFEVIAGGAVLWLYARYWKRLGEAAPLLALIPFYFAFRSPPNYFAVAPWLALFAWLWMRRDQADALLRGPRAPEPTQEVG